MLGWVEGGRVKKVFLRAGRDLGRKYEHVPVTCRPSSAFVQQEIIRLTRVAFVRACDFRPQQYGGKFSKG